MGKVKRWEFDVEKARDIEDSEGRYVLHSDYARLERERDRYKTFHDETMPVLEAAQGLRNRLESTERAMAAQADELTRLRAVEAAAERVISHYGKDPIVFCLAIGKLAEACGRKW